MPTKEAIKSLGYRRAFLIGAIPWVFLMPLFIYGYISYEKFTDLVISGKIQSISVTKCTTVRLDTYPDELILGFIANGLTEGDSVIKTRGNEYYYFKRDSAGIFREINFHTKPNKDFEYPWQWTYSGENYHKKSK